MIDERPRKRVVSPYLLQPLRALEDVLKTSKALTAARATARRSPAWDRGSDTAAATLRQQGHISRPRVVWVNNTQGPIKRPRKKD